MEKTTTPKDPATVYEEVFVPALFGQWAAIVAEAARIEPGQRVLGVACGTGVLARAAHERSGGRAEVVGLDLNEAMLVVAARHNAEIEWRQGNAEALPFGDESFDRVVSQFGLMFFERPEAALREMWRVLRPGGKLVVAVWDAVESSPGYVELIALLERTLGAQAADALRLPFRLGDRTALERLFADAGLSDVDVQTHGGKVRFPTIRDWVAADVEGWLALFLPIGEAELERVLAEAERTLRPFTKAGGSVEFDIPAHLVLADR